VCMVLSVCVREKKRGAHVRTRESARARVSAQATDREQSGESEIENKSKSF